ncbi:hypothetical protein L227DRAFT_606795 [Lentinus tigrinus ALCF2SS1-6]|uniref:Uncharacterized protein n=1 Tax=Lentinus tigrinus ALCF2SS1-6 TaxID=1328759 RepID=A0A5C2SNP7_9APHY|nr:hypothetical protein L227DRAFT_606795 [Lentinus tigrinus ALCF2SS1-6]
MDVTKYNTAMVNWYAGLMKYVCSFNVRTPTYSWFHAQDPLVFRAITTIHPFIGNSLTVSVTALTSLTVTVTSLTSLTVLTALAALAALATLASLTSLTYPVTTLYIVLGKVEDIRDTEAAPRTETKKKRKLNSGKSSPSSLPPPSHPSPSSASSTSSNSTSHATSSGKKSPIAKDVVDQMKVAPSITKRCGFPGCTAVFDIYKQELAREHWLGHLGWQRSKGKWFKVSDAPSQSAPDAENAVSDDASPAVAGKKRKRAGPERTQPQVPCKWEDCGKQISDSESYITRHLYQDHLQIEYRCLKGCPADKRYSRVDIANNHGKHPEKESHKDDDGEELPDAESQDDDGKLTG